MRLLLHRTALGSCIALGLLGLWSSTQGGGGDLWVGAALLLAGMTALRSRPLGGILPQAPLEALLLALAAFHLYKLIVAAGPECGCLLALGNPGRFSVLIAVSALLLALTWTSGDLDSEHVRSAVSRRWSLALGLIAGLAAALLSTSVDASHEPPAPGRVQPQGLQGLQGPSPQLDAVPGSAPTRNVLIPAVAQTPHALDLVPWAVEVHGVEFSRVARCLFRDSIPHLWLEASPATRDAGAVASGEMLVAGRSRELPNQLFLELHGRPALLARIDWTAGTRRGRASVELAEGRPVRVKVVDGLGVPVPGLGVALASTPDLSRAGDAAGRAELADAEGIMSAVSVSDEDGVAEFDGWGGTRPRATVISPGWSLLERDLSELAGGPLGSEAGLPPVDLIALRVGRHLVAGVVVRETADGESIDSYPMFVRWSRAPTYVDGAVRPLRTILDSAPRFPQGTYLLAECVAPDSRFALGGDRGAGTATVAGLGFAAEDVAVSWTLADAPVFAKCRPTQASPGSPSSVEFEMGGWYPCIPGGLHVVANVADLGGGAVTGMALLAGCGDGRARLSWPLRPGRYELRAPGFLTAPVGFDVPSPVQPRATVRADLCCIKVAARHSDGAPTPQFRLSIADPGFGLADDAVLVNQVVGLDLVAQGADVGVRWVVLGAGTNGPRQVLVRVGQGSRRAKAALVDLVPGECREVAFRLDP